MHGTSYTQKVRQVTQEAGRQVTQEAGRQVTQVAGRQVTQVAGRQVTQVADRQVTQVAGRQVTQVADIGEDTQLDVLIPSQFVNSNRGSKICRFLRKKNEKRAQGVETGKGDLVTSLGMRDGFYKKFRGDLGGWGGGDLGRGQVELVLSRNLDVLHGRLSFCFYLW